MKSQRGSMAVIALVMMLFLVIAGVAWLPMLSQENSTARNDWEEQQAWYAAEAGFIRAKTELNNTTSAGNNWSWLAPTKNIINSVLTGTQQAQYSVTISPTLASGAVPVAATTYTITSVGQVNGLQKTLKGTVVTASSGSTTISLPGVIQAGGTVTIENSNNSITGGIYAVKPIIDRTGNQNPTKGGYYKGKYPSVIATKIPDSVFVQANYANLTSIPIPNDEWDPIKILTRGNYLMNWPITAKNNQVWRGKLSTSSDVTIFVHSAAPILFSRDVLSGPTDDTKPPLTIIFDNDIDVSSGSGWGNPITGNIRILAKGKVNYIANGSGKDRIMIAANGDIDIWSAIVYGLLSSNDTVTLKNSSNNFQGQIICKNDLEIETGSIAYSDIVAKTTGFTWPVGMQ